MNVGYGTTNNTDAKCPLCDSDVYISKYGTDYKCMNKDCLLFKHSASELIRKIKSLL